jgi:hypothetical protein
MGCAGKPRPLHQPTSVGETKSSFRTDLIDVLRPGFGHQPGWRLPKNCLSGVVAGIVSSQANPGTYNNGNLSASFIFSTWGAAGAAGFIGYDGGFGFRAPPSCLR